MISSIRTGYGKYGFCTVSLLLRFLGCRRIVSHGFTDLPDVDVDRAQLNTSAATDTLHTGVILINVILELVHEPLSDPRDFIGSWIMAGTLKGKEGIHAAVPVANTLAFSSFDFILNVKAPAGGTAVGAGAAI
jgi:hypothetical protein